MNIIYKTNKFKQLEKCDSNQINSIYKTNKFKQLESYMKKKYLNLYPILNKVNLFITLAKYEIDLKSKIIVFLMFDNYDQLTIKCDYIESQHYIKINEKPIKQQLQKHIIKVI